MSAEEKPTGRQTAVGCGWMVVGLPVSAALQGLAWFMLWGWFVAPLGAPAISYGQALGLALFVAMVKAGGPDRLRERQSKEAFGEGGLVLMAGGVIRETVLRWLLVLLFGWLLHLAIGG